MGVNVTMIVRALTWARDGFEVSTDPKRLDLDWIHEELSKTYWGKDVPRSVREKSIGNSVVFGLYDGGRQIGFARLITDRATFAYLCDVVVAKQERGQGLGKWAWFVRQMRVDSHTTPRKVHATSSQGFFPGTMSFLMAILLAGGALAAEPSGGKERAVLEAVSVYNEAMRRRSTERLERIVDADLLVLEGVHKNVGWPDYRDNHIGPEMAEWTEFRSSTPTVSVAAASGDLAYVVQESTLTIITATGETTLAAAETFVLRRRGGAWRIVHVHFSGKKKAPMPASPPAMRAP